jgi:Tfp pilus assembly protein PilX
MNNRSDEKGVALFFALVFILILSVLCVSIMFLSQSETWSSLNYRMTTQGRYGAEDGLNTAANFIVGGSYTAPTTGGTDSLANYDMTKSPVQYNGSPVVLSTSTIQANFPVSSVVTAYKNASSGSGTMGNTTVN